ncbi:MAG TPA: hypothetical protein VJ204_11330 [Solirubrobacterales bacterium]|nr:hypothetical protein [Solirubrobacterales bacterium]
MLFDRRAFVVQRLAIRVDAHRIGAFEFIGRCDRGKCAGRREEQGKDEETSHRPEYSQSAKETS